MQIPSLIIAKFKKVTVALTGDGGMRYLEDILDIYGRKISKIMYKYTPLNLRRSSSK